MVVVRNCDLGDFAPVLVFLSFFFIYYSHQIQVA